MPLPAVARRYPPCRVPRPGGAERRFVVRRSRAQEDLHRTPTVLYRRALLQGAAGGVIVFVVQALLDWPLRHPLGTAATAVVIATAFVWGETRRIEREVRSRDTCH